MTRGVLYVATGKDYFQEAQRSVRSLKRHHPELPATLLTDEPRESSLFDVVEVIQNPLYTWGDKIHCLLRSSYDRTLFLDTDTVVCGELDPVYDILDEFELAVAEDPYRETEPVDVPDAYPEYNTGVIAYRQTEAVHRLIEVWGLHHFQGHRTAPNPGIAGDQPAFRKASYETAVNMTVLPTEFNCRYPFAGAIEQDVAILHGRVPNPDRVAERLNEETGVPRVFHQTLSGVSIQSFDWRPWLIRLLIYRFRRDLRQRGPVTAVKRAAKTLVETVETNRSSK